MRAEHRQHVLVAVLVIRLAAMHRVHVGAPSLRRLLRLTGLDGGRRDLKALVHELRIDAGPRHGVQDVPVGLDVLEPPAVGELLQNRHLLDVRRDRPLAQGSERVHRVADVAPLPVHAVVAIRGDAADPLGERPVREVPDHLHVVFDVVGRPLIDRDHVERRKVLANLLHDRGPVDDVTRKRLDRIGVPPGTVRLGVVVPAGAELGTVEVQKHVPRLIVTRPSRKLGPLGAKHGWVPTRWLEHDGRPLLGRTDRGGRRAQGNGEGEREGASADHRKSSQEGPSPLVGPRFPPESRGTTRVWA